ncbi:MAG: riboflavin synthase [Gammaproteobacteria bacterium]|nr:riboflavin synthase [Gammaproteobacteria bacterium]
MFTGIIQALGTIASIESRGGDLRLAIDSADLELENCALGDSIAVNGVCLTVVTLGNNSFAADVSLETIARTSLGMLKSGSMVNLEKALTLNTMLGGHLVSGHVDGLASIVSIVEDARSIRYSFEVPFSLQHYIAEKGSVTVDGTSLTVNRIEENQFDVNIVPHTQQKTIFGNYRVSTQVNLEVDIIARYLERLIKGHEGSGDNDQQLLKSLHSAGFLKSNI